MKNTYQRLGIILLIAMLPLATDAKISINLNHAILAKDPTFIANGIMYLGSRAMYYDENPEELPTEGNIIPPSFSDELFAFVSTIAHNRELNRQGENILDYWSKMIEVSDSGYIEEYIAVFRKKEPNEETASLLKIEEFKNWALETLIGIDHNLVESYGSISNGEVGGEDISHLFSEQ